MRRRTRHVTARQLELFGGDELEAYVATTLGSCPQCASPRVFVRKRLRLSTEHVCGECDHAWGSPGRQPRA
jgi:hypothetical protein